MEDAERTLEVLLVKDGQMEDVAVSMDIVAVALLIAVQAVSLVALQRPRQLLLLAHQPRPKSQPPMEDVEPDLAV